MRRTLFLIVLAAAPALAQQEQMSMPMQHDAVADFLMSQASGTSTNPAITPMTMSMLQYRDWTLMLHGSAFVNQVVQTGPRGADQFFSTNWIMGMADRKLGPGHLMLRSMLSLEPLTVGKNGYPELFQTGEGIDRSTASPRSVHGAGGRIRLGGR